MFSEDVYGSWKPKQMLKYEQLAKHMDMRIFHKKRVLDLAAGPCWFEEFLAEHGTDVSNFIAVDKSLRHLLERSVQVAAVCSKAESIRLYEKFDIIIALDCLHLFDFDFKKYLKNNSEQTHKVRHSSFVIASLFFNKQNLDEKRKLLKEKLKGLKIEKEIVINNEQENEIFAIAH